MIYIGIDDTDTLQSRGTGHLARMLAAHLAEWGTVFGVTRHQLLFDRRVPYTAKNSCACVHLDAAEDADLSELGQVATAFMLDNFVVGSDPGLCIARDVPPSICAFGQRVKTELVQQDEARTLAADHGILLRGLGGTEDGVIGALAAVGLAVSGQDGRFPMVGSSRDLLGIQPISAILAAGISEVRDLDEQPVDEGMVATNDKVRPAFRSGVAVLYVERDGDLWRPIKKD